MRHPLKIARVIVQTTCILTITWTLMTAPTAAVIALGHTLSRLQLIPAAMAGSLAVIGFWLMVTLVFGRLYCSTVCPLGTLQDIASRLGRPLARIKAPYRYAPPRPWYVRGAMLILLIVGVSLGSLAASWATLPFLQMSPYDGYTNIVSQLAMPVVDHATGHTSASPVTRLVIAAAVNLIFLIFMAITRGREVCNTLCPVGAALGTLNHLSMLQIDIDTDRCTHCRRCEYVCRAQCLDSTSGTVDAGRCVTCFDCLDVCRDNAIHYTMRRHRLSMPMLQSIRPPRPALSQDMKYTDQLTRKQSHIKK